MPRCVAEQKEEARGGRLRSQERAGGGYSSGNSLHLELHFRERAAGVRGAGYAADSRHRAGSEGEHGVWSETERLDSAGRRRDVASERLWSAETVGPVWT